MKMYILVKDSVPLGHAINSAAHASLAMYLAFGNREEVERWLEGPFKKVVCKVTQDQFEQSKQYPDFVLVRESALDNAEVAIAFMPRDEWPKFFKFLTLYK